MSPFRAFEPALVPAVTKVKALVGTLKVVKMLRRRGSVKVNGKNQLDDQELAAVRVRVRLHECMSACICADVNRRSLQFCVYIALVGVLDCLCAITTCHMVKEGQG